MKPRYHHIFSLALSCCYFIFCSFGGIEEPCAWAELVSVGGFRGKNAAISSALMAAVEKALGISPSRFYIKFAAVEGSEIGWQGSTF